MTNVQMEISSESEVANEATCRNTGIHHVGLHAANPAASAEFYSIGMFLAWRSSAGAPLIIRLVQAPF